MSKKKNAKIWRNAIVTAPSGLDCLMRTLFDEDLRGSSRLEGEL